MYWVASYAIEEYAIKLKHGAASYVLHTVHRVAIPLSKKVETLLWIQTIGIISWSFTMVWNLASYV